MWLMLFYCNDDADMGIEYQLRQENPPGYLEHMRRQLPSVFVDEVEDILNEPSDGIAYATRIGPWSFIAGCDETMVHSTPFVHHRGAFFLASVLEQFDNALRACFGAHTAEEYSQNVLPASQEVVRQLKGLASSDDCVDRGELEKLLQGAGFTAQRGEDRRNARTNGAHQGSIRWNSRRATRIRGHQSAARQRASSRNERSPGRGDCSSQQATSRLHEGLDHGATKTRVRRELIGGMQPMQLAAGTLPA
jgi:hypothetical protein